MKTYTYKKVGDVEIKLNVYRADDEVRRPVLVWLHGGALIVGSRTPAPPRLTKLCRKEGFALISLDYRLAPEVKLPAIIEDVQDAFRWIRKEGPTKLHVDPDRLVVSGGSAGGYLTLMSGICIEPRPRALVSFFGYGDVDGAWYTTPSQHYRTTQPLHDPVETRKAVGGKVLTGIGWRAARSSGRARYYHFLRQNGWWTREVTGFDPKSERDKITPYCPVRNVTKDYPPTLLIHGTEDTDVPYQLSADMAAELQRHGAPHELVTVEGAGHGLGGVSKEALDAVNARAEEFIKQHLK